MTGGSGRTSKNASTAKEDLAASQSSDSAAAAARLHARQQAQAKQLARDVLVEVVFDSEWKELKMEMPTATLALKRMKAAEMRKVWYEEDEKDWLEALRVEWIDELRGDFETNKKFKALMEEGKEDEAKAARQERTEARADSAKKVTALERTGKFRPAALEEEAARQRELADAEAMMKAMGLNLAAMQGGGGGAAAAPADKGACAACGGAMPKKNICGKCAEVAYCGRECQVKHWPEHKALCKQISNEKAAKQAAAAAEP